VLKIFHPQHETELHTVASIDGFGAVLLKKSPKNNHVHPVYYMSKKTTDAERTFSSYELKILAVNTVGYEFQADQRLQCFPKND